MTTALYRRYRPETFVDVIGQEHVTGPLMAAITAGRVSHAYLFSGPRGCGKTTSARILARCLNCEQGPVAEPCGTCASCVELSRGGPGSLDVVEIDAASHNGVDDARELRERAAFAPARDRFKIFILDEAHMVTTQGFNALLKLVEEPPEHVKFVFATTEPDKVISTIRSRTHHYPFRLVPPDSLHAYLEQICAAEGVEVGSGVLPLVVRAGGGSVRDSLSVLDQLLAGAAGVLDYDQAVALLGYTPATLLDDAVDALAAADGASIFRVVERVVDAGHEPRRFVEDLLQRLRDLIVIVVAGERAGDVLRGVPADQRARMGLQAEHLGLAQLSRAADLTNTALTEMTGATSPRLQLELLCARLLLPTADEPVRGYGARIERLEKRWEAVGAAGGHPGGARAATTATAVPDPRADAAIPPREPEARPAAADQPHPVSRPAPPASEVPPAAAEQPQAPARPAGDASPPASGLDTETVRRRWPEVLETLYRLRRSSWTITSQNAQVLALDGAALRLRFDTAGIASTFRSGPHAAAVEQAVLETLGAEVRIDAVADDAAGPAQRGSGRSARRPAGAPTPGGEDHAARAAADWADAVTGPGPIAAPRSPAAPPGRAQRPAPAPPSRRPTRQAERGPSQGGGPSGSPTAPVDEPTRPGEGRGGGGPVPRGRVTAPVAVPEPPDPADWEPELEDEPDLSDPDLDDTSLVGAPLVEKLLGATLIDDIPLDPSGPRPPAAT